MNYINILEKLRAEAAYNNLPFSIETVDTRDLTYKISIGQHEYLVHSFTEEELFDALIYLNTRIIAKAEIIHYDPN